MRVTVDQLNIDGGTIHDCERCPVALAILDHTPDGDTPAVWFDKIFYQDEDGTDHHVPTPPDVAEVIAHYDQTGEMYPFCFVLEG